MKNSTIKYYDENALELTCRYESVSLLKIQELIKKSFLPNSRILEIGCGSGRDAAWAVAEKYDVAAVDGSAELLSHALEQHPELKDRLFHKVMPAMLPFADLEFAGFYSIACLMHFCKTDIRLVLNEINRVLNLQGRGVVSVPVSRNDVDNSGIDEHGRIFNLMPVSEWLKIFGECGFSASPGTEEPDSLGREGINWITFALQKK